MMMMMMMIPDSVVMADTVNQFKNRLDKHWANYAFLYDYLVNYNGTGSLIVRAICTCVAQ